ncbi:HTH-type transcriptional regulator GltC [Lachnospiraceae bacterium]|nr:HTH-type transcriptional regulator GltC [Lachnospiraceae bacterium]
MIELAMWKRLVTIYEYKTLSKAAEKLYLTQSALSRSMQKLEKELDVKLFVHNKNNITFTKAGEFAVVKAKEYLAQNDKIIAEIQQLYRNNFVLSYGATSMQPIWDINHILTEQNIKQEKDYIIKSHDELIQMVLDNNLSFIITHQLPDSSFSDKLFTQVFCSEQLYLSVPETHELAAAKNLQFEDFDGETLLLYREIGFWKELCTQNLPRSNFLIIEDHDSFFSIVMQSPFPSFATDIRIAEAGVIPGQKAIPITNPEATATHYLVCKKENASRIKVILNA